ncbi:uncharacterized protein LOC130801693 [Amaranthus tricolor]|uniref:uncharacterized protein LOC130801693 n=1 Tax=Amaranthus tricolor TaxID=29722 RepID=UPI0025874D57|nr:uncharacterized protein LOC130801693 [Amaranthus tricolor]
MKNSTISASKRYIKTQKKQKQSPKSPLMVKDLNILSSCSSSFSSSTSTSTSGTTVNSVSSEAPMGCLRFFLSHDSSDVSKSGCNRKPRSCISGKNPKSTSNVKHLKENLSNNGRNVVKNRNNLHNLEKPTKKNPPPPPCVYPKSSKKPRSRSNLSDGLSKLSVENTPNSTPVIKLGNGFHLGSHGSCKKTCKMVENNPKSADTSSPIPPIQASVSPDIQGGSTSVVKATPTTCYAAGHVLSGVSDKRKCRPRGLLTIGDNDLFGSCKTRVFSSKDENFIGILKRSRVSLVPSLEEASMHWILYPCDEKSTDIDDNKEDTNGVKLNSHDIVMPSKSFNSPSSSLGFSSDCDATSVSHGSESMSSEFRAHLWPSFEHFVRCPSPALVYVHDYESETTLGLEDSVGSGNVIQTPQSNSSSEDIGLSRLSIDELSRPWFECELNSVAEALTRVSLSPECELPMLDSPKTSFEFKPLIKPDNSIDFASFRKAIDDQISYGVPEPLFHNSPESEVQISWRDMDDLDCCRCFSDEEDNANDSNE